MRRTLNNTQNENKIGTEKMSRLIIATGIPLMLSLLINSLYNFVDSVFIWPASVWKSLQGTPTKK